MPYLTYTRFSFLSKRYLLLIFCIGLGSVIPNLSAQITEEEYSLEEEDSIQPYYGLEFISESVPDIDPIRFIKGIYELDERDSLRKLIWAPYQKNGNLVSRRSNTIDPQSRISIEFDKDALVRETNFTGNITLVAEINSRNVEVAPYSEVGADYKTIGTSGLSPNDFTELLLGFIQEVEDVLNGSFIKNNAIDEDFFDPFASKAPTDGLPHAGTILHEKREGLRYQLIELQTLINELEFIGRYYQKDSVDQEKLMKKYKEWVKRYHTHWKEIAKELKIPPSQTREKPKTPPGNEKQLKESSDPDSLSKVANKDSDETIDLNTGQWDPFQPFIDVFGPKITTISMVNYWYIYRIIENYSPNDPILSQFDDAYFKSLALSSKYKYYPSDPDNSSVLSNKPYRNSIYINKNLGLAIRTKLEEVTDSSASGIKGKVLLRQTHQKLAGLLRRMAKDLKIIDDYIKKFVTIDPETFRAFSYVIKRDEVFLQNITDRLSNLHSNTERFANYVDQTDPESMNIKEYREKYDKLLSDVNDPFKKLLEIKNGYLEAKINYIGQWLYQNRSTLDGKMFLQELKDIHYSGYEGFIGFDGYQQAKKGYLTGFLRLNQSLNLRNLPYTVSKKLRELLTTKAGKYLYKKLIPGRVDLRKQDAVNGDVLSIYILWHNSEGNLAQAHGQNIDASNRSSFAGTQAGSTSSTIKKIPVARFNIKRFGWNLKVAETVLLVHPVAAGTDSTYSRFQPAPGVSLQLTYTDNGYGGLLAKLEPSIGLNVSYLNFDREPGSSFEIGVGVLLGFLNNKVFVGWGRNLHVPQARDYFTLGFSFTNIVSTITDSWSLKKVD